MSIAKRTYGSQGTVITVTRAEDILRSVHCHLGKTLVLLSLIGRYMRGRYAPTGLATMLRKPSSQKEAQFVRGLGNPATVAAAEASAR
jgi:hypothetical protein